MPIPRSDPTRRLPPGARRSAILALLQDSAGPVDAGRLATALGLHPNTVRAHLAVLVRAGAAARVAGTPGGRGRPRDLYRATEATPGPHEALATALAERLAAIAPEPAAEAVRAGREWADRLLPDRGTVGLDVLVDVLDDIGFAPELVGDDVHLHACPFRHAAVEHPEVVCSAHLGLIQRTMERCAPGRSATLRPFVEPTRCVAHVGPAPVDQAVGTAPPGPQ